MSCAGSISVSWRTESPIRSPTLSYDVTKPMIMSHSAAPRRRKMNVASAKHSGMKFPSWREPKPIRVSRPSSPRDLEGPKKNFPIIRRSLDVKAEHDVKNIVNRLSAPTFSAKMKNVKYKPNTVMMNMNYYSWANMAAYKDHQRTLYTGNGTMKRSCRKSAKR